MLPGGRITFPLTFSLPFSLILWFFNWESFSLSWGKEASLVYPQIINCCSHLTYTQTAHHNYRKYITHQAHGVGEIHHPVGPGIRGELIHQLALGFIPGCAPLCIPSLFSTPGSCDDWRPLSVHISPSLPLHSLFAETVETVGLGSADCVIDQRRGSNRIG